MSTDTVEVNTTKTNSNNNVLENKKKEVVSHAKNSWIWAYFNEEEKEIQGKKIKIIVCQVQEENNSSICNKTYMKSDGSTGNAINHLLKIHDITKEGKINKV